MLLVAISVLPDRMAAQDLTHPREMGLPESRFEVPGEDRYRFGLRNGIVGFFVADRTAPVVTLTAFVRAGKWDDGKQGAAEVLEMMLQHEGPCWMAPGSFGTALDDMAAEYYVRMTADITEITLSVAADDAMRALRIFSGILRETCVRRDGLDKYRSRVVTEEFPPGATGGEPGPTLADASLRVAVDLFHRHLYEGHLYGEPVTQADVAALTVEDVRRFRDRSFDPGHVVLAVSGWFDPLRITQLATQQFSDWEGAPRPPQLRRAPPIQPSDSQRVYRYRADKLQSFVVLGHELPPVSPEDWPALEVMNYILGGGHFDTRLFREARDKRGLTNDASGFLEPHDRGPGSYTFRTYSRPEVSDQLVQIVFGEIDRIRNEPVTEEELFVAKGALVDGALAVKFANGHAMARTFAVEHARRGTVSYPARYSQLVQAVTAEDVLDAARRYLKPERMTVVVIEGTRKP